MRPPGSRPELAMQRYVRRSVRGWRRARPSLPGRTGGQSAHIAHIAAKPHAVSPVLRRLQAHPLRFPCCLLCAIRRNCGRVRGALGRHGPVFRNTHWSTVLSHKPNHDFCDVIRASARPLHGTASALPPAAVKSSYSSCVKRFGQGGRRKGSGGETLRGTRNHHVQP